MNEKRKWGNEIEHGKACAQELKTSSLYTWFLVARNHGSTVNLTVHTDSEPYDTFETNINSDSEVDQPGQWRLSRLTAWAMTAIQMEVVTTRVNWKIRSELTFRVR